MGSKNTSLATTQPAAALVNWNDKETQMQIREAYGKNLNEGEWKLFMGLGMATGLNPFLREIWAVKYGSNPASVFVGRDGYRRSAQAHQEYEYHYAMAVYANDDFSIKSGVVEHDFNPADRGELVGAYCIVKRKSASREAITWVSLSEYKQNFGVWTTKPATMIIKVAEAQGLRASFQELFAGTYEESEAWKDDAVEAQVTTPAAPAAPVAANPAPDNSIKQGTLLEIKDALTRYSLVANITAEEIPTFGAEQLQRLYKKNTLAQLTDGEGKAFASYLGAEAFKLEQGARKDQVSMEEVPVAAPATATEEPKKRRGRPANKAVEEETKTDKAPTPEAPQASATPKLDSVFGKKSETKLPEDEIPPGKIRTDQTKKLFAVWGEYKKVAGIAEDQSAIARKRLMSDMFHVDSSVHLNENQADELIERIEALTEMARENNYKSGEDAARLAGDSF